MTIKAHTVQGHRALTLTLRPCSPVMDLSTDLTMSHLRRWNRSRHGPSSPSYTLLSSTICNACRRAGCQRAVGNSCGGRAGAVCKNLTAPCSTSMEPFWAIGHSKTMHLHSTRKGDTVATIKEILAALLTLALFSEK